MFLVLLPFSLHPIHKHINPPLTPSYSPRPTASSWSFPPKPSVDLIGYHLVRVGERDFHNEFLLDYRSNTHWIAIVMSALPPPANSAVISRISP